MTQKTAAPRALGFVWRIDRIGCVQLRTATRSMARAADSIWRPLRPVAHGNLHWSWETIIDKAREAFALTPVDDPAKPLALWSSGNRHVKLASGTFYRLDYLEVAPPARGTALRPLALATAFDRALELHCFGVLLAALPEVAHIYDSIGFDRHVPGGWTYQEGLVGFVGYQDLLRELVRESDAYRENRQTSA